MEKLNIRKLESEDVVEVFEIEKHLIGKTSKESIEKSILSETLYYYVIENEKEILGFYEVSIIPPEAELYDIAIKENFQGRGYSKILIEHLFSLCKSKEVDTIFLEVNSINKKAITLYEHSGFEPYGIRKNYYGENDAILMKFKCN